MKALRMTHSLFVGNYEASCSGKWNGKVLMMPPILTNISIFLRCRWWKLRYNPLNSKIADDSTIKFHEVQMLSYSLKKTPRCTGGSPSVKFPGYLKAHKGRFIAIAFFLNANFLFIIIILTIREC